MRGAAVSIMTFVCSIAIIALILVAASHPALGFAGVALALLGGMALIFIFYTELSQEEKVVHESRRRIRRKAVRRAMDALEEQRMRRDEEERALEEEVRREKERLERLFEEQARTAMSLERFKELVERLFRRMGYSIEVVSRTDDGIDFVAAREGNVALIGAKNCQREKKVGIEEVYRALGAAISQKVKKVFLITTSSFTQQAREETRKVNESERDVEIELWDGERLQSMTKEHLPEERELGLI